jgi:hypothetical protein
MSLGCCLTRPVPAWPKKRWVVREELVAITDRYGVTEYHRRCYEDYVLDWPWMQCRGSSGARIDTVETNEQHGLLPSAVKALEEARATFPD